MIRGGTPAAAFRVALAVTFISGGAALGHQLLWTRRLIDLLGASGESAARVFGAFFLGLALGAALAARWAPRIQRPWRAVGWAEAGVLLLALPAWALPYWNAELWAALGPERLTGWPGSLAKLLLSLLVVMPPAFMMGCVLPWLALAVLRGPGRSLQRHGVWLYAVNTAGGAAGLLVTGLGALPTLGMQWTMLLLLTLNAVLAAVAWGMETRTCQPKPAQAAATAPENLAPALAPPLVAAAFVSGLGVLAVEVVFLQLFQLSAIVSFHATLVMLLGVILMLALASLLAPWLALKIAAPRRLLAPVLALAGLGFALAPVLFMSPAVQAHIVQPSASLPAVVFKLLRVELFVLGPGLLMAGLVFPLVLAAAGQEGGDARGRRLGWLLAVNGLGGFLGAELAYRVLLPQAGVHLGLGGVATGYALCGLLFACWFRQRALLRWATAAGAAMVLLWCGARLDRLPLINEHVGLRLVELRHGREGQVAVVESDSFGLGLLVNNQYLLGSTGSAPDQERQAHLPLLLHPRPERVAFLGLATGSTAAGALRHGGVAAVTALELSPLVAAAARDHFADVNAALFTDPRARVVVEDGRTWVAAHREHFDVVVADLFLPWRGGVGRLFSEEHYRAVHEALRPGGVFCHWLPMHQLTAEQTAVILATFARVFPTMHLARGNLHPANPHLGVMGFKAADWNWEVVGMRTAAVREEGRIRDAFARHSGGVALLYLGRYHPAEDPAVVTNTLGNGWLEFDAGRTRLTVAGRSAYLHDERWLKWAAPWVARAGAAPDSSVARAAAGGQLLTQALRLRQRGQPVPEALRAALRVRMPAAPATDPDADWLHGPDFEQLWSP